jgi:hypothetical protein
LPADDRVTSPRHTRQSRLAEVGARGQERIRQACVEVPFEGFAGEIAARYLAGAGVGALRVRDPSLAAAARDIDPAVNVEVAPALAARGGWDPELQHHAARELARGARWALDVLRGAVEGDAS